VLKLTFQLILAIKNFFQRWKIRSGQGTRTGDLWTKRRKRYAFTQSLRRIVSERTKMRERRKRKNERRFVFSLLILVRSLTTERLGECVALLPLISEVAGSNPLPATNFFYLKNFFMANFWRKTNFRIFIPIFISLEPH